MSEKEYIPFGEEWRKHLKTWSKDALVGLLRTASISNLEKDEQLASKDVDIALHNQANKILALQVSEKDAEIVRLRELMMGVYFSRGSGWFAVTDEEWRQFCSTNNITQENV